MIFSDSSERHAVLNLAGFCINPNLDEEWFLIPPTLLGSCGPEFSVLVELFFVDESFHSWRLLQLRVSQLLQKSQAESTLVAHVFAEKAILASLAQTTDAELLAAEFVRKPVRSLAARHTRSTSNSQRATATKEVEAESVLEVIHSVHCLYTIQAPTTSVNTFRHLSSPFFKKNRSLITNHLQLCGHKKPRLRQAGASQSAPTHAATTKPDVSSFALPFVRVSYIEPQIYTD